MKITTAELRRAVDRLLEEFETLGAAEWDIDVDFYWDVPSDVRYESYDAPKDLSVGQLADDIERVRGIAAGTDAPAPPGLVWVASVLRFAGERGIVAMKRPRTSSSD